jgi:NAD-dependent SIR2 family protein deacetylase
LLLWIGAGNSFSSGVPLDRDDDQGLAFRLASIHYNNDLAQMNTALGQNFRLADLAAVIGRARIRELIVQQGWIDLPLSASHRAIAALLAEGFNVEIVTVNYDPLLEKALDEEGLGPTVIYSAATYRHRGCPADS